MNNLKPEAIMDLVKLGLDNDPAANAALFNTMRILKKHNPGDTYLENYLYHYNKRKDDPDGFVDYYHLLWNTIGPELQPEYIMEIGCRTGISICQLLSSMMNPGNAKVYLFDIFNDGFISPEVVKMNLRALNLPTENIKFFVGNSLETVPEFIKQDHPRMDYILVDGCHDKEVAKQDLANVIPLLNKGGIIIFDDIAPDGCNLIDVWNDFKEKNSKEFYFAENMSGKGVGVGINKWMSSEVFIQ